MQNADKERDRLTLYIRENHNCVQQHFMTPLWINQLSFKVSKTKSQWMTLSVNTVCSTLNDNVK